MKKRFLIPCVLSAALLTVSACTTFVPPGPPEDDEPYVPTFTPHESAEGIPDRRVYENEKIVLFSEGGSPEFHFADGYSNGNEFNCTWRESSGAIQDGLLSITVSKEEKGYAGAEYRARNESGYGFFATRMKPAACSGIISSFFIYTWNPWDEIDIEFLGKDTTQVQFNYYTNGVGNHTYLLDLGYDASEEFHEYGFDWQPDSITWYVDGIAVYRATKDIPSHPAKIMMNVWNPITVDWSIDWCGRLDETALPATAQYEWIAYSPML